MLGGSLAAALSSQVYIWLLGFFAGAKAVAVLGVASSLANVLSPLLQGASAFLLPKMVHSIADEERAGAVTAIVKRSVGPLLFIFALWLFVGILFGDEMLTFLYSSKYAGYGSVLVVLIGYSLVSAITVPISAALDALKRSDVSFRSSLGSMAVGILAGVPLIALWGAFGAAVSALLANLINLILRWRGYHVLMSEAGTKRG